MGDPEHFLRTEDEEYGADYWQSLDNGAGYQDGVFWEDLAHAVKEIYGYDGERDMSSSLSVVDVGCAYGYLVRHLRRRGFDAWGLDFSAFALQNAPEDVKDWLRWFDLTQEDDPFFGYGRFNLLTCLETLEHIPEPAVPQALTHLYGLLKPGGHALLTICVDGQPDWETDPTHVTIRSREWWEKRLTKVGFESSYLHATRPFAFRFFYYHQGCFTLKKPG